MSYKLGDRMQKTFFPSVIDDYIGPHDPVRVYDSFVEALDFSALGIPLEFNKGGADEYFPKAMLKLLIYGYSYGTRSSRKLERACHHNLSFIWLIGGLKPDYRTIARFRSEHKEAIKKVLKQCVRLCIKLDLIEGNTLFIDGSSFRANASIKRTWTRKRCKRHLKKIDQHIDNLIDKIERIDEQEEHQESLVKLKKELQDDEHLKNQIQKIASELNKTQERQHNTTDPDCVKVKSRQGTHAGYNVQVAVDEKHGLIVNSETTISNQDANQFNNQINQASETLGKKPKVACSDAGYHSLDDLSKVDKDITVVMPSRKQAQQENNHPLKPFHKDRFEYDAEKDQYICPEGKRLSYTDTVISGRQQGNRNYRAKASECRACHHFGVCTKCSRGRNISRLKEEKLKQQLEEIYLSPQGQEIYKLRKEKAELPFGHMKRNLSAGQFLLRGKTKTDAEVSLLATGFNIARMITLIGIPALILRFKGT